MVMLWAVAACETSAPVEPAAAPAPAPAAAAEPPRIEAPPQPEQGPAVYPVPERTDEALSALLNQTCAEADAAGKPWLVEVGAPWCGDCRALAALEQQPALAEELSHWPRVQVNIGDFDRHEALRKWLHVRAIAHWSVLSPRECPHALGHAPILQQRTLEPRSGAPVTAERLAEWLRDAREAGLGD